MTTQLVIVGNGMAAVRLVEQLLQLAPTRYAITLIGDEPGVAYNRILLSPVLGGEKSAADTTLHPLEWYQAHGVTVLSNEPVLAVNVEQRTVTTQRQQSWSFLMMISVQNAYPFPALLCALCLRLICSGVPIKPAADGIWRVRKFAAR